MDTALDAVRKRCEERLAQLEERLKGKSSVPARKQDATGRELQTIATERAQERQDFNARLRVQKREIESLKEQLQASRRKIETMQQESCQQQANVTRLVEDWEQRLRTVRSQEQAVQDTSMTVARETVFLKAENGTQAQRIEVLETQVKEQERALQAKDQEITRLFTRIENLEEENLLLVKKAGEYQMAVRDARSRHDRSLLRPKAGNSILQWLTRPVIVLQSGDTLKN